MTVSRVRGFVSGILLLAAFAAFGLVVVVEAVVVAIVRPKGR